jgi:Family of unknown function (DUF6152)
MKAKVGVFALGVLAAAVPMLAHHSFSAEFDGQKRINLKGTVVKVEWMNPHIWIYLDVKDDAGATARWQCEGGPPNSLTRNGWTKDALKEGDRVSIDGTLSKDGSRTCNATSVNLPDGRRVFAGSSGGDAAAPGSQYVNPSAVGQAKQQKQ